VGIISLHLEIPFGSGEHSGVEARLPLFAHLHFEQGDVDAAGLVRQCVPRPGRSALPKEQIETLINLASIDHHLIDEFDLAQLIAYNLLIRKELLNDSYLAYLAGPPWNVSGVKPDTRQELLHRVLAFGHRLHRLALPRIRAKLALQEVVVAITGDLAALNRLLAITPKYLGCEYIQRLIRQAVYFSRHGDAQKQHKAEASLEQLLGALVGDRRQKDRWYAIWSVDSIYEELRNDIEACRSAETPSTCFNKLLDSWKVSATCRDVIKSSTKSASTLALEVMVDTKLIKDPTRFYNVIRPRLNQLRHRHPEISTLDAEEPLTRRLLDLPSRNRKQIDNMDLWNCLKVFEYHSDTPFHTESG
jgi:hypothetical protein